MKDYPIDDSLKICRKYNADESVAFLLDRNGAVKESIELYLDTFEKRL